MHCVRLVGVVVLALVSSSFCFSEKPNGVSGLVWSWSENCGHEQKKYLGFQIILGPKAIYESSVPICRTKYGANPKTIAFRLKGGHTFQGEHRTLPEETVEANIWLAGSDPDAIIFGLDFSTKKRILLNTVHIARPDRESTSKIDRGMWVRTFPVRN